MSSLPDEIWSQIFVSCCTRDVAIVASLSRTCKHFRRLVTDQDLWKHVLILWGVSEGVLNACDQHYFQLVKDGYRFHRRPWSQALQHTTFVRSDYTESGEYKAPTGIVLLGSGCSGKTVFVNELIHPGSGETSVFNPTIEDMYAHAVEVAENFTETVLILDTGGNEILSSMQDNWFRRAGAYIVFFDVTDAASYESAKELVHRLREVSKLWTQAQMYEHPHLIPVVLFGNKADLLQPDISPPVATISGRFVTTTATQNRVSGRAEPLMNILSFVNTQGIEYVEGSAFSQEDVASVVRLVTKMRLFCDLQEIHSRQRYQRPPAAAKPDCTLL